MHKYGFNAHACGATAVNSHPSAHFQFNSLDNVKRQRYVDLLAAWILTRRSAWVSLSRRLKLCIVCSGCTGQDRRMGNDCDRSDRSRWPQHVSNETIMVYRRAPFIFCGDNTQFYEFKRDSYTKDCKQEVIIKIDAWLGHGR